MKKSHRHWIVTLTAILCITLLEAIALVKGVDGTILAAVIAAIAGLGGFSLGQIKKQQSEGE